MEKENIKINNDGSVVISADHAIYPLETIYQASYLFLDKAYIHFSGDPEAEIKVKLTPKEDLDEDQIKNLAGEFFNELINVGLRNKISENSKTIREYIVSAALVGASKDLQNEIKNKRDGVNLNDLDDDEGWDEDPMGIATPWEEKNENKEEDNK